jgi:DNA polymerase elongation subunit (family B)
MLGTPGLPFNSPANAARVTTEGRRILEDAIEWTKVLGFQLVNADTDSISFSNNGTEIRDDFRRLALVELNARSPEKDSLGRRWCV